MGWAFWRLVAAVGGADRRPEDGIELDRRGRGPRWRSPNRRCRSAPTTTAGGAAAPAPGATVFVKVNSQNTTATAGPGYQAVPSTTLTYAAGETVKLVPLDVVSDELGELDETCLVKLTNPVGAVLGDGLATVTILDDEGPTTVTVSNAVVREGGAGTTATLRFRATALAGASGRSGHERQGCYGQRDGQRPQRLRSGANDGGHVRGGRDVEGRERTGQGRRHG